ncbi:MULTISPECIES: hypothetical protein [unclassified Nodularia (in: cyanobacteria)]|uniref:hypothetical protein n=1 Tax=unclassified Nodularia (in: cyanobacteria) TaxID=2656917 RepID=UPI001882A708|nr:MULTISPECIES: hypothetical protein [unclassified Nodularia (in: cyanobacteria)]MBE9197802.1 hypothetical protein [Nodularia sp. LEGE 06071]MCC2695063.1 hypothetical protein [Nodularia sp. LEGE 04288]
METGDWSGKIKPFEDILQFSVSQGCYSVYSKLSRQQLYQPNKTVAVNKAETQAKIEVKKT